MHMQAVATVPMMDVRAYGQWLRRSEGPEEGEELGLRPPPRGGRPREPRTTPKGLQGAAFHLEVGSRVAASRRDAFVAEVVTDHVDIDASLQERDRAAVTKNMRAHAASPETGQDFRRLTGSTCSR